MKKIISLAALVLVLQLAPAGNLPAEEAKKFKIGALTKSLANPYFLRMKEGYEYAQKKLGVDLLFGSTPKEEADVEHRLVHSVRSGREDHEDDLASAFGVGNRMMTRTTSTTGC